MKKKKNRIHHRRLPPPSFTLYRVFVPSFFFQFQSAGGFPSNLAIESQNFRCKSDLASFFFVAKPFLQRFDLGGVVTEFCLPSFTERLGPVNQCLPTQRKVLPSFFTEFFFFNGWWGAVGIQWTQLKVVFFTEFFYRVFFVHRVCLRSIRSS